MTANEQPYDRLREVKQFDDSKIGVKGLVDSGLTTIPRFFQHPPNIRSGFLPSSRSKSSYQIPIIDLSNHRTKIIDQIKSASSSLGFFQIINHNVPKQTLNHAISSVKAFNELPTDEKSQYYHRNLGRGASFSTNFDLYQSQAASWRDTLQIRLGPTPPNPGALPEDLELAIVEWDREIKKLGEELMGLISEGLGLEKERLKDMSCLEARTVVGHYYPYCPQPDLTIGISSHTDPGVLTVLQQNEVGGLQVKFDDDWVDIEPVSGALVINIGDLLQIMSNDELKSVEHRVLANPNHNPRLSIAVFFNPSKREELLGPLPELVSAEKPPVYREFMMTDFLKRFFSKELDGKSLTDYYKI
ncbi:1-aminocyclopropane-1-carboxylate oxidase homolog 1-like [Impatiens glandulifera]|uniref:1-aminocyclopropane-1-carboxylate oxidase homolog 1-like n=1 Tax=Impatiens glandulifera TaxID=253017 RepID=UPI001FB15F6E|nr:1-aminocyclopropane-1-carboxylate oxidase homolog 1-like [Impatiens glandulifera]